MLAALFAAALQIAPAPPASDEAARFDRPAQAVTLPDGRRMNLVCLGTGAPTVIFAAGLGASAWDWRLVAPQVARTTRACAFDKAGMGFSDPAPPPRDAARAADDLEALLKSARIAGPYVLVGHSLGSYDVRLFANRHPEAVAGMVLVDPSGDGQDARFYAAAPGLEALEAQQAAAEARCIEKARMGTLARSDAACVRERRDLPEPLHTAHLDQQLSASYREARASENASAGGSSTRALVASRRSYGDMPLIVLTAGRPITVPGASEAQTQAINRTWMTLHDEMAALSRRGVNRVVPDSGHSIPREKPQAVIDAVVEVVDAVRAR